MALPTSPTLDGGALPAARGGPVALQAGRPTFAEVYEAHFAFAWRTARRLGIPAAMVEDVTQEIFVVVHRRLHEFEGRSSMRTWLFSVLVNVVRNHRRSLLRKNPHSVRPEPPTDFDALEDPSGRAPDDRARQAEASRVVHELLDALDDDKRQVFVLAELEQMSAPDIAAAVRIPVNTVYSRLRVARQEFAAAAARYRARHHGGAP